MYNDDLTPRSQIPPIRRLARGALRLIVDAVYRIRVVGAHRVPEAGGALLISNHASYMDPILLSAALRREVRFLMWRKLYDKPGLGHFARFFRSMPIAQTDSPQEIMKSLDAVVAALREGDLVCVFPEGGVTRTGHILGFKRGFELIARRAGVPVIPVHVDGSWGSVFSFEGGRFFWKRPKRIPRPITISFGAPTPPDAGRTEVRQAIMELGAAAWVLRKRDQLPLHVRFWRNARRSWWRPCMADSTGAELTWGRALAASLALARWIKRRCDGERMVGMMMPASCGAALANAAALIAGKVPVNLNFTGAKSSLETAIRRCGLKTVFTSRALLERAALPERPEYVYLDEVAASLPLREKATSYLLAALIPSRLAERRLMRRGEMDDLATVMFTSGSTGEPKGVMLSHHNVVSNIEAMAEVIQFGPADTIMGVLPPFHSFGFTTTLWIPLTCRVRVAYHPNPLDAKGVGRMVQKHGATLIMGTSSFYALYTRGCEPEQFRTLRLVIAGGQKLMPAVAKTFEERFGIPVSEGYGCTELSPVVSVNVPDVTHGPVRQAGTRASSVGRPLPGLAVRIADGETLAPAAEDSAGIVLVKGPTVMLRYMDDAATTEKVIHDGWYVTADIGSLDEDGFLYIHDRISRFSKIAGEMVPHGAVETALQAACGTEERRFAVVTMPDRIRGEKLVVVYSGPALDPNPLLKRMAELGVPNLWLPAAKDFYAVDAIPLLPTGKTDLLSARRMAEEKAKEA